jgi:hypothetical protein
MLPIEVISQDTELESAIERDTSTLAELRWHWTMDETNPDRVSFLEYGRQVGRDHKTIAVMAQAYASYRTESNASYPDVGDASPATPGQRPARQPQGSRGGSGGGRTGSGGLSLSDHIGRARFGKETGAAAEAVARARGLSIRGVSDPGSKHHNEVRRVRDIARQLAEEHGTSVEEEVDRVAQTIVREEQARREEQEDRAQRTDLRVIQAEQQVLIAKRAVLKAIRELEGAQLDDEGRDLLTTALDALKAASALMDARLSGKSGIDWDAELAKLSGGDPA